MTTTTWPVGSLVRCSEGRGTVFSLSPLGGFAVIKLLRTGAKITVRVTALSSGRLS